MRFYLGEHSLDKLRIIMMLLILSYFLGNLLQHLFPLTNFPELW